MEKEPTEILLDQEIDLAIPEGADEQQIEDIIENVLHIEPEAFISNSC